MLNRPSLARAIANRQQQARNAAINSSISGQQQNTHSNSSDNNNNNKSTNGPKRGIPIDLFFRGSDLLKADLLSDSDPYLILYEIPPEAPQASPDGWRDCRREVGRTETIDNNLNPVWTKCVHTRYIIGASQRFLCRLIDDDDEDDDHNDPLGDVSFHLSDVMNAPNYTIMVASPTQGSVMITARISLRKEGMTIERVPIPRTATVVDALQKSTRVTETGTTDISFPSSDAFWKALHSAIALAPTTAQAPPHLHIECTNQGDGILVNKVFLIDFLDQWNESVTHTITLTVGDGSRAFRAVPAMWEQLLKYYNGNPSAHGGIAGGLSSMLGGMLGATQDDEPIITVESNQDPHRRKVKLPWSSWVNFTKLWDQQHDTAPGDTFGQPPTDVETQMRERNAQQQQQRDGDYLHDGERSHRSSSHMSHHQQQQDGGAAGSLFPSWTDRSQRMPCSTTLGRSRNVSATGTYWTNFMKEWTILQAAARNHLPSGYGHG